jgi:hypothetical protein
MVSPRRGERSVVVAPRFAGRRSGGCFPRAQETGGGGLTPGLGRQAARDHDCPYSAGCSRPPTHAPSCPSLAFARFAFAPLIQCDNRSR